MQHNPSFTPLLPMKVLAIEGCYAAPSRKQTQDFFLVLAVYIDFGHITYERASLSSNTVFAYTASKSRGHTFPMDKYKTREDMVFGIAQEDPMIDEEDYDMSEETISSNDNHQQSSNNLKFYPYSNNRLTRSAGTLNLSLSNINLPNIQPSINRALEDVQEVEEDQHHSAEEVDAYINRWSPFNDGKPATPTNLKRTASKSELSPFVNNPDILRKWNYDLSSSSLARTHNPRDKQTLSWQKPHSHQEETNEEHEEETPSRPFSVAKPDPSAFKAKGLVSKIARSSTIYPHKLSIPDTPVKRSPLIENTKLSNSPIPYNNSNTSNNNNNTINSSISDNSNASTRDIDMNSSNVSYSYRNVSLTNETSLFTQASTAKKAPTILVEMTESPTKNKADALQSNKYNTNKYKKIKKARNSIILKNRELTNSLQQFADDLYGADYNYSPTQSDYSSQKEDSDSTPTRRKSFNEPKATSPAQSSTSIRHKRTINATVQTNPDSHLFEKFANVSAIGQGQFSKVYQVTFAPTGKRYAVKSIHPNKRSSMKRILQEIRLLSEVSEVRLDQEGKEYVIEFLSSWKHQSCFYIMTEYYENGNLDGFLQEQVISKQKRLDDWRIWKIIVELCLALRFIHDSCKIVHLDLKPANIMITFEGNLKLGDFGMATHLPLEDQSFENEGDREYIAPEIISDSVYDFRADIFSLGLLIVEIAANVVLPDNGNAWHKLRSGDLSDAGKLSSTDIYSQSVFSNPSKIGTELTVFSEYDKDGHPHTLLLGNRSKIPAWVPKFLIDGESLERMVKWMIEPHYKRRPTADEILHTEECIYVEMTRRAGAIIQEDDFGPKPDFFSGENQSQEVGL